VVKNICRHVALDVVVTRPIYPCLLGRRQPLMRVTVLKEAFSGWFSDVGGHVTALGQMGYCNETYL